MEDDPANWPHTTEDGSKAKEIPGGGGMVYFNFADGTKTFENAKGETVMQIYKDGTILENFPEDEMQRTTLPDGTELTKTKNGTTVMIKDDIKITRLPVGITIEEHRVLGYKATKFPDGYTMIEQDNGISVDRAPDGTTHVCYPDGTEVDTLLDGTKKVKTPEGRIKFVPPPIKLPPPKQE